jgi:arsenate reductase
VDDRKYNVLFLCTGNSARSIIAEALLNQLGAGRMQAFSAGSNPSGSVNPLVLEFLHASGVDTEGTRSKSWDEFALPGAPAMDLVVTVCDRAGSEVCPIWPGAPAKAHWSAPDPAELMHDPEKARQVIREVAQLMRRRISLLLSLPIDKLDRAGLQERAADIARQ